MQHSRMVWPAKGHTYLMQTVQATQQLLQLIEDASRQLLLPTITGKSDISDVETHCSASPSGWHGYFKPYCHITNRTQSSLRVTVPLVDAIIEQHGQCNSNTIAEQHQRGGRKMKHSFNHSYHQNSRN